MSNNIICKTLKGVVCVFAFFALSSSLPAAQYKPLPVDGDGKLATGSKFVSANGIATKSDISNLKKLTLGDGLLGTSYNGSAAVSTGIDFSWLLEKRKSYQQDFRLFIDTQPSPSDNTSYISKSRSNTNFFYYKDASGSLVRTVNSSGNSMSTYATYMRLRKRSTAIRARSSNSQPCAILRRKTKSKPALRLNMSSGRLFLPTQTTSSTSAIRFRL